MSSRSKSQNRWRPCVHYSPAFPLVKRTSVATWCPGDFICYFNLYPRAKMSTHLIKPGLPEAKEFLHFDSHSLFVCLDLQDGRKELRGSWGELRSTLEVPDHGNELKCTTFQKEVRMGLCYSVTSACSQRYCP